jgi:hypothetical protein
VRELVDRSVKGSFVRFRGFGKAAHFSHKLNG